MLKEVGRIITLTSYQQNREYIILYAVRHSITKPSMGRSRATNVKGRMRVDTFCLASATPIEPRISALNNQSQALFFSCVSSNASRLAG